jgi:hypothetical protein
MGNCNGWSAIASTVVSTVRAKCSPSSGRHCHTMSARPAGPDSPQASRRRAVSRFLKQARSDLLPRDDIGRVLVMPSDTAIKLRPLRVCQRYCVRFQAFPDCVPAVPPSPQERGCLSDLVNRSYSHHPNAVFPMRQVSYVTLLATRNLFLSFHALTILLAKNAGSGHPAVKKAWVNVLFAPGLTI